MRNTTLPGTIMIPEVTMHTDGTYGIDWTGHKRAGSPIGPYITLSREQWLGLVTAIKRVGT
jgi:hypothetical protein